MANLEGPTDLSDITHLLVENNARFHGKPCRKCGGTLRYRRKDTRCVACFKINRRENERERTTEAGIASRKRRSNRQRAKAVFEKYGYTEAQLQSMSAARKHECTICGTAQTKRLSADHCHKSGKFRGLLCPNCNVGLGFFKDDPVRLLAAIKYLKNK